MEHTANLVCYQYLTKRQGGSVVTILLYIVISLINLNTFLDAFLILAWAKGFMLIHTIDQVYTNVGRQIEPNALSHPLSADLFLLQCVCVFVVCAFDSQTALGGWIEGE